MHLYSSLSRIVRSVKRVARTHYPGFIFGLPLKRGEIPAFVYHDVEAKSFIADLSFLADNGYQTLTTNEFVTQYNKRDNTRSVLLTFDDARRNFWEVAFPLLREFNARATLFVPTYWIGGRQRSASSKEESPAGGHLFMTWDELRSCARSGLVDIQAHAHRHALVYKSMRLVTFASPHLLAQQPIYDWPMRQDGHNEMLGPPLLGTPIYEAIPLLSACSRVLENAPIVKACQEVVAAEGGEGFFARPSWATRLLKVHQQFAGHLIYPTWMDEDAFQSLVASEFLLSRHLFEAELGVSPRYFAYPWMLGSDLSLQLAAETGIKAVFGVGLDCRRAAKLRSPLSAYGRIKGDWLRFLPGQGGLRLHRVIPRKLREFLGSQHLAH